MMKILISNDDGINAEGIKVLEEVALRFSTDVTVVAPSSNKSGAGHSLTLNDPLRVNQIYDRHYSVNGTPTDCVVVGMRHLLDEKPDFVFSGINCDSNLAEDITYSGTIAAAMEACLLGIPAIAFSQQLNEFGCANWTVSRKFAHLVIEHIIGKFKFKKNMFLNVNFPAIESDQVKGFKVTHQGFRDLGDENLIQSVDPRGVPYFWIGSADYRHKRSANIPLDSDIGAANDGYVSITPLSLDLTAYDVIGDLESVFK
jgi:5'-nucleotidase